MLRKSSAWRRLLRLGLAAGVAVLAGLPAAPARAQQAATAELVDHSRLRVCADPANLPFSNQQGEGFENKIALLLAERLQVPVAYTWYPQTIGFVRNTLNAYACDLVMGVGSPNQQLQNTNPYYRSTYVLAHRAADGEKFADLASPTMKEARIGVIAPTPPVDLLVQHGLLGQIHSYPLPADTRVYNPGREMIDDLAAGRIDVALLWGPVAGYWAARQEVPIELVALAGDGSAQHLDFRISMGMRRDEPDWKHAINDLIDELQPEFDRILREYHVPLLDRQGRLMAGTLE